MKSQSIPIVSDYRISRDAERNLVIQRLTSPFQCNCDSEAACPEYMRNTSSLAPGTADLIQKVYIQTRGRGGGLGDPTQSILTNSFQENCAARKSTVWKY